MSETSEDYDDLITDRDLEMAECVASGSSCEVYRGYYKKRLVAIKKMSAARGGALGAVKELRQFSREVAVLRHLSHPHLVELVGFAQSPMRIVNEFCDGGDLRDLLHNCEHVTVSWGQRLAIVDQVSDAMAYLHGHTPMVWHRDLKTANLLLTRKVYGVRDPVIVKVADFGLARMLWPEDKTKLTLDMGTMYYKAPEMLLGQTYDEKVDVYSFAVVLYEISTRHFPWEELPTEEVIDLVVKGQRPEPEEYADFDTPDEVLDLIRSCWAHSAADRPPFSEVRRRVPRAP